MKNYNRPSHPYTEKKPRKNSNTFRLLKDKPLSAEMLDQEFNSLTDQVNELAEDIKNTEIKGIDGANKIENAEKLLTTTGQALQWTKIGTGNIDNNAITRDKIKNREVTSFKIAEGAVGANELGEKQITSDHIAPQGITGNRLANKTITAAQIADKTITEDKLDNMMLAKITLGEGSVENSHIKNRAVTKDKIDFKQVVGSHSAGEKSHIAPWSIGADDIGDGAIIAGKLGQYAVTKDNIDPQVFTEQIIEKGTITGGEDGLIAKDTITGHNIAAGSLPAGVLGTRSVGTDNLEFFSITSDRIIGGVHPETGVEYRGAVTTPKIADEAITTEKLAGRTSVRDGQRTVEVDGSVIEEKIADEAVTEYKIAKNSIDKSHIKKGAVTTDAIGVEAISHASQIKFKTLLGLHFIDDAILENNYVRGSVSTRALMDKAVTKEKLDPKYLEELDAKLNAEITPDRIPAGLITESMLDNNSVSQRAIQPGVVQTQHLDSRSVISPKLGNSAVTQTKIHDKAVVKGKLAKGAVTRENIEDKAITFEQLSSEVNRWMKDVGEIIGLEHEKGIKYIPRSLGPETFEDYNMQINSIDGQMVRYRELENEHIKKKTLKGDTFDDYIFQPRHHAPKSMPKGTPMPESITTPDIEKGAITGPLIDFQAVDTEHQKPGSTTNTILAGGKRVDPKTGEEWEEEPAVSEDKIQDGSVTERKLAGEEEFVDGKWETKIQGAVSARKLQNFAVENRKIAGGAVTFDKIANQTIISDNLAKDAVTSHEIKDGSIITNKIYGKEEWKDGKRFVKEPGAVTEEKIRDEAVTTPKIDAGAVTFAKLGQDVKDHIESIASRPVKHEQLPQKITTKDSFTADALKEKIGLSELDPALRTWFIKEDQRPLNPDSVGEAQLIADCVVETKVCDGAITENKLSGSEDDEKDHLRAVTTHKIRDEAVTGDKIKCGEIGIFHLHPDLIDTFKQIPLGEESVAGKEIAKKTLTKEHFYSSTLEHDEKKLDSTNIGKLYGTNLYHCTVGSENLSGKASWINGKWARETDITSKPSVTEEKIADSAINVHHLQDTVVSEPKLASGAVSLRTLHQEVKDLINKPSTALVENAPLVKKGNVDVDAVATENIANLSVTFTKLEKDLQDKLSKLFVDDGERPLKTDSVITDAVKDLAITAPKIAPKAVGEEHLQDASVATRHLQGGKQTLPDGTEVEYPAAVTEDKIRGGAVTADKLFEKAVTTSKLDDQAVTGDKIDFETITHEHIKPESIYGMQIAEDTIDGGHIQDGSIDLDKLSSDLRKWFYSQDQRPLNPSSVTTVNIEDKAVTGDKIDDRTITRFKLSQTKGERINHTELEDDSVTYDKLAFAAVDTPIIKDKAVTLDKLDEKLQKFFGEGRIADVNSVVNASVKEKELTGNKFTTEAGKRLDTDNLEDGLITFPKLDPELPAKLTKLVGDEYSLQAYDGAKLMPQSVGLLQLAPNVFDEVLEKVEIKKATKIEEGAIKKGGLAPESVDYHNLSQEIKNIIHNQLYEVNRISSPLGSIMFYTHSGLGTLPRHPNWVFANGQFLCPYTYEDYFELIGYSYGREGDLFQIPDIDGRAIIGYTGRKATVTDPDPWVGKQIGLSHVQLTWHQMPRHTHHVIPPAGKREAGSRNSGPHVYRTDVGDGWQKVTMTESGASEPHNNIQPSVYISVLIRVRHDMSPIK